MKPYLTYIMYKYTYVYTYTYVAIIRCTDIVRKDCGSVTNKILKWRIK